jgi:putative NIF3 family GTP cyclohydrolase 1 type 2
MVDRDDLKNYCHSYLSVDKYKDYGPNGLQIEGTSRINKIISGVSANLDLIECAIEEKADAIEDELKAKFLSYPMPKAIVEEWEKVK